LSCFFDLYLLRRRWLSNISLVFFYFLLNLSSQWSSFCHILLDSLKIIDMFWLLFLFFLEILHSYIIGNSILCITLGFLYNSLPVTPTINLSLNFFFLDVYSISRFFILNYLELFLWFFIILQDLGFYNDIRGGFIFYHLFGLNLLFVFFNWLIDHWLFFSFLFLFNSFSWVIKLSFLKLVLFFLFYFIPSLSLLSLLFSNLKIRFLFLLV